MYGRYERQIALPEVGIEGQERLRSAKVLIVGVGGLGSPIALYLAGAGVGTIGLVDDDKVALGNLQRQVLYSGQEVGLPKVGCAARRLRALNSGITVNAYDCRLDESNVRTLFSGYDIIVDGCDNFATRYLMNDACQTMHKPYVYGAIGAFEGQVSVFFHPHCSRSYRDLYPDEEAMRRWQPGKAVMGVTPAVVGSVEAAEVLKLIGGYGEPLAGRLWTVDLLTMQSHIIAF